MGDTIDTVFLYLMIACKYDDGNGFFLSCLSQGGGIDESRKKVADRLKPEGIKDCFLVEAGIIDSSSVDFNKYEPESKNNLRLGLKRYEYSKKKHNYFINPEGIVISAHSPAERDALLLSYSVVDDNYAVFTISIVPDVESLELTVKKISQKVISDVNFIGVYLNGNYDDDDSDYNAIWVKTGEKEQLIKFLIKNKLNLLENGFVAVELGNQYSNNRLRITEAKELLFWTDSLEQMEELKVMLNKLRYTYKKENVSTGKDFEHFKYRKKGSLNKENLMKFLTKSGFKENLLKE